MSTLLVGGILAMFPSLSASRASIRCLDQSTCMSRKKTFIPIMHFHGEVIVVNTFLGENTIDDAWIPMDNITHSWSPIYIHPIGMYNIYAITHMY